LDEIDSGWSRLRMTTFGNVVTLTRSTH
jgi:hypothetical protein